ncbi:MAG: 30S ribosomal protein S21 [bacterium]
MQEIKRKREESFESLLRRFNRKLQQSGKIIEVKQKKFFEKEPNKNQRKASALVRNKIRAKREYLKKTGKLPDEFDEKGRRIKIKIKI